MKITLLIFFIFIISIDINAADKFVRNDGSNSTNCNGNFDAAYDGSGTGEDCAYSSIQNAHDLASCGDTIFLKATHTWTSASSSIPALTVTKSCTIGSPLRIKSTLADTIPESRPPTLIPSGAILAKMANINGVGGTDGGIGAVRMTAFANVIFDGIHFSMSPTGNNFAQSLIDAESGTNLTIRRSYGHPPETSTINYGRSVERFLATNASGNLLEYISAGPFVGYQPGTGTPGSITTSEVVQCVACIDLTIRESQLNAHYAAIFLGGGDTPPAHTATMTGATTTSATFSNVTSLTTGIFVRLAISGRGTVSSGSTCIPAFATGCTIVRTSGTALDTTAQEDAIVWDADSVSGNTIGRLKSVSGNNYITDHIFAEGDGTWTLYQTVLVTNIAGNVVTYTATGAEPNELTFTPDSPGEAAWSVGNESLVNNVLVKRNIIDADYPFSAFHVGAGGSGPKGYWEVKNVSNMTVEDNEFIGFPATPVWFGLNQAGTAPWTTVKNVIVRNNYFHQTPYGSNGPAMVFMVMKGDLGTTTNGSNFQIYNNLILGAGLLAKMSNGADVQFYHNTVIPFGGAEYNSSITTVAGVTDGTVTFRDNIIAFRVSGIQCLTGGLAGCWPTRSILNNVFVDNFSLGGYDANSYGAGSILTPIVTDFDDVGFTNYNNGEYGGNFSLSVSSPYKGDGTSGSDPGVDWDALITALGPSATVTCNWNTSPVCQ